MLLWLLELQRHYELVSLCAYIHANIHKYACVCMYDYKFEREVNSSAVVAL